ncbi:hypothetical protein GW17_00007317 [Ensete ventricosum]|nr:hypothetical protein GW17_00007317 [Ensete ventricosum]
MTSLICLLVHTVSNYRLGNVEFIVCQDTNGTLRAFHNVCRHHASLVASGSGQKSCFVCPYHGWTYGLDGTLLKATRITGIKNFKKDVRFIFEKVSIQRCEGGPTDKDGFDRLGSKALYAFVYPNFMINRFVGT